MQVWHLEKLHAAVLRSMSCFDFNLYKTNSLMFSVAQYHWFNRPTQNPQKSKDVNFSLECIPCLVSAPLWRSDLKHKQSRSHFYIVGNSTSRETSALPICETSYSTQYFYDSCEIFKQSHTCENQIISQPFLLHAIISVRKMFSISRQTKHHQVSETKKIEIICYEQV